MRQCVPTHTSAHCSPTASGAPLLRSLSVAEHDPLHDEGAAYAQRLHDEGVEVLFRDEPGLIHGFLSLDSISSQSRAHGRRDLLRCWGSTSPRCLSSQGNEPDLHCGSGSGRSPLGSLWSRTGGTVTLEFGMWDHFERLAGVDARHQYDERIALVKRAEELGFYGYRVAEHHLSWLSMAPSPLMFLTALARETSRIRLGSMIVIVPLYPTVRLAEDVCVLDALSGGRLEFGVGRGIRDAEHEWWGDDPASTASATSRPSSVSAPP